MASDTSPLIPAAPARGVYAPAGPNDVRSPCPLVNSLANHGYIARNGKNIHASEIYNAMSAVGLSRALRAFFAYPIFNEKLDAQQAPQKKMNFFQRILAFLRNPWGVLAIFGVRKPNQVDGSGRKVLNLDQIRAHGVVEHDVSITRRDVLQPEGNCELQPDLVRQLMKCSSDGEVMTMKDLAALRRLRIRQQLNDNPGLEYGEAQHTLACGEIALILGVFGNDESIPCSYVRALFEEERLPVKEGWKKRWWWTLGLIELGRLANTVKTVIGLTFPSEK